MDFKTNYTGSISHCRKSIGITKKYAYKIMEDGSKVLSRLYDSDIDLYAEIQLYKDDADIYSILRKVMQGDISLLDKNKGAFADLTDIPDNINDFRQMLLNGKSKFMALPAELKRLFGNDYGRFAKVCEDGQLDQYISNYKSFIKGQEEERKKNAQIKMTNEHIFVKDGVNNEVKNEEA